MTDKYNDRGQRPRDSCKFYVNENPPSNVEQHWYRTTNRSLLHKLSHMLLHIEQTITNACYMSPSQHALYFARSLFINWLIYSSASLFFSRFHMYTYMCIYVYSCLLFILYHTAVLDHLCYWPRSNSYICCYIKMDF